MYNYSVVSAPVIYELLYTVINYGHLKEPVKLSEKEKDAGGSTSLSAIPVSVGEAPHRFCLFVCLFVCLVVSLFVPLSSPISLFAFNISMRYYGSPRFFGEKK